MTPKHSVYGLAAEFDSPEAILDAATKVHRAGYTKAEGYTPFPVHGLSDALGFHKSRVPQIVLAGGVIGGISGFFMCYYANVISYTWNIGGRPMNSWPAWIPITFETTILFSAFAAVFGMLALNGLPRPHHPLFNLGNFQLASRDRFFICIEQGDPEFDLERTRHFLESLTPIAVLEVPW